MTNTKKIFAITLPVAVLIEVSFAYILWRHWYGLLDQGLSGAYQAAAALLIGWPTIVFALAATYAGFRSAVASERQAVAADRQAVAADAQARAADKQSSLAEASLDEETRPFLVLERAIGDKAWNEKGQYYRIRNVGRGTALGVVVNFLKLEGTTARIVASQRNWEHLSLAPDQHLMLHPNARNFEAFHAYCRSVRDKRFRFGLNFVGHDPIAGCLDLPQESTVPVSELPIEMFFPTDDMKL